MSQVEDDSMTVVGETVVVTDDAEAAVSSSAEFPSANLSVSAPGKPAGAKKRVRSSSSGCIVPASGDDADDIYIDTKDLCGRIAYELKAHSIPQAVFAERVLCRLAGKRGKNERITKLNRKFSGARARFRTCCGTRSLGIN